MFSKKNVFVFLNKIFFCIIITLIILIGVKSSSTFKLKFYEQVFETNISFAQINEIYEKYAGSSIPFKEWLVKEVEPVFHETLSYQAEDKYLDGVKLTVESNYLIPILEDGLVIFVGEKENYGNTIIIGQSNGIDVWYSNIENPSVQLYDMVEKGSLIGSAKDNYFYLVFKKDGQVLNYEDYL